MTNRRRNGSVRDGTTDMEGRTSLLNVSERNVRQRTMREGPIRQPLLWDHEEAESSDGSISHANDIIDMTGEGEHTLMVTAIDPGTAIATEINPVWRGISTSWEERLVAIENRCNSNLTGELSEEQLHSLDDNLQMKLARTFYPMIDKVTHDLDDFVDTQQRRLDNKLLTLDKNVAVMLEDRIQSEVMKQSQLLAEDMQGFHVKQFERLTGEMQTYFVHAEEVSSTKLFALQGRFLTDNMEVKSRLLDLEANGVKDRTLASEQIQETTRRLDLLAESVSLTKQNELLQTDHSITRYLEMNDIFRMTLEAHVNDKFEALEDSIKQVAIQVKDTNLQSQLSSLLKGMEDLQKRSEAREGQMQVMIQQYQAKETALEDQLSFTQSSVTNLEDIVKGLEVELLLLREQARSNHQVSISDQLEATNAPTGKEPLTNSTASLYLNSGAFKKSRMTGGESASPPANRIMIGDHNVSTHQGEYMFTRLKSAKKGNFPIIISSSANAPNMMEMGLDVSGSSEDSFNDSDYHSSDGNSFMDMDDPDGSDSSSSTSSSDSSSDSSDSSSSSSDSSSDTSSSSESKKHSKKNKKRKRKAKKHKKSKHRKQENLFPQTPFRSLSPIGHNNTMGTPSNMMSNTSFSNLQGGTHTLRMAAPPPITMVRNATWEDLEKLRRQIEVAEIQKFEVKIASYLSPSVTLAIEKTVKKYFEEVVRIGSKRFGRYGITLYSFISLMDALESELSLKIQSKTSWMKSVLWSLNI